MYITRETDYAVRISIYLAANNTRQGAAKLSQQNDIPSRFTLKILRKLMEGGIIKSHMGAKGGYELARPPGEITLLDIIETVEGPYIFSRCIKEGNDCITHANKACCKPHGVYTEITELVRAKLAEHTLEMLVNKDD